MLFLHKYYNYEIIINTKMYFSTDKKLFVLFCTEMNLLNILRNSTIYFLFYKFQHFSQNDTFYTIGQIKFPCVA